MASEKCKSKLILQPAVLQFQEIIQYVLHICGVGGNTTCLSDHIFHNLCLHLSFSSCIEWIGHNISVICPRWLRLVHMRLLLDEFFTNVIDVDSSSECCGVMCCSGVLQPISLTGTCYFPAELNQTLPLVSGLAIKQNSLGGTLPFASPCCLAIYHSVIL